MYEVEKKLQPKMNKKGLYSFRLGYYDFKNCKFLPYIVLDTLVTVMTLVRQHGTLREGRLLQ